MNIHISWNNEKNRIILPVNPEEYQLSGSMNNTSVTVHNFGEINLKGKRNLRDISFESFFPGASYSFSQDRFKDPYYYVEKFEKLMEDNETVHLVITETNINGFFTVESFAYGNKDGTKDVYYTLVLKEYREINSKRVKKKKSDSYKWKKNDTWQSVTKKQLGSSKNWKKIKKKNAAVIKKAKKKYPKKKERDALIGYKVVLKV